MTHVWTCICNYSKFKIPSSPTFLLHIEELAYFLWRKISRCLLTLLHSITENVKTSMCSLNCTEKLNWENSTNLLQNKPSSKLKREKAFGKMDADHSCECGTTLCDAGLPAAVEIKQLIVSHVRMQSRPSDRREQKVGRRHVSGRGSRGAFVRRQWQKGVEGALLDAIQRQFVSLAAEARPKTREQLEPCRDW